METEQNCDICGRTIPAGMFNECWDCSETIAYYVDGNEPDTADAKVVTDGGTDQVEIDTGHVRVRCAGCNDKIGLGDVKHIRNGHGFCASCGDNRFGTEVSN